MGSHRVERVAAQLRQEISDILLRDLKDPRIGLASITEVKLSGDLRNATVKVSVPPTPNPARARIARSPRSGGPALPRKEGADPNSEAEARQAAIDGLEHAKGFIRRELGARLSNLRFAPDLHFELDEGVAYSVRVSQLLREAQQGESDASR